MDAPGGAAGVGRLTEEDIMRLIDDGDNSCLVEYRWRCCRDICGAVNTTFATCTCRPEFAASSRTSFVMIERIQRHLVIVVKVGSKSL